jgi:hypothetical protein
LNADNAVKENFIKLQNGLNDEPVLKGGFVLLTVVTTGAETGKKVKHGLGTVPKDVVVTRATGSYTLQYDAFTNEEIVLDTAGAVDLRLLVGKID